MSTISETSAFEKQLANPGARATLPVAAAKKPFSKDFVKEAFDSYNSFHAQTGGDHTLYYLLNLGTIFRTDLSIPNAEYTPLNFNLNKSIGSIKIKTESEGELILDDYITHPTFRHQGVLMLHTGKIVYEKYPGMSSADTHFGASASKTIVGLMTSMLVEEGNIDTEKTRHQLCKRSRRYSVG